MSNVGKRVNVIDRADGLPLEENVRLQYDRGGFFKTIQDTYSIASYRYIVCEEQDVVIPNEPASTSILLQAEEIVNGSRANDYGGTEVSNLQLLCKHCNRKKSKK